ncbi:PH domain-containing protein [Nocardia macrotermitis]|uniref:PH domain-containing protein n=1 Tax=Nocardia macrotermitis TaxID=2585198 RepID=UPI0029E81CAC|nr:PH domain-containing protein [Nocardia macrotermitis]
MTASEPVSRLRWSTPPAALVTAAVGGIVLAVAAIFTGDAPSRLLVGLAALLLLGLSAVGLRQRPRLSIVPGQRPVLVVRGLLGAVEYPRDRILRARVVSFRRLGRKSPNLEIDVEHDGEDRLLIFGRWDLGTHPQDVLDALVEHGLAVPEPLG